ncbi:MAG: MBOAT family protein, partial [Bacteroidota bacterium]|nr:MBOAT family protein [Bacteroidota bacterium]
MLFNSIDFAIFLPLVFLIYWGFFGRSLKGQNAFLLLASMVFYGWWDWRFLGLVFISAAIDYVVAITLDGTENDRKRKLLLATSMIANLGMLAFFKYFDFFISSFTDSFMLFGRPINSSTLNIVLPVGISFYTFQTMSYTIDVYRRQMKATRDWVAFGAYILFFPQLVAGPIERGTQLLPQFHKLRPFNEKSARDGLRQMLWGLFKKVIVADNCAFYADQIFGNEANHYGGALVLGVVLFAFQIYADFSGYSDIAIGAARLFSIDLMRNFNYPYFSRDIGEFWRRWHISLSTWFRDYLYIPLGGSKGTKIFVARNVMIIFLVSGLWHGANWTYVAWGALNGLLFLPLILSKKHRGHTGPIAPGRMLPSIMEFLHILLTFFLICLTWVFFRATSMEMAFNIFCEIFSPSLFQEPPGTMPGLRLTILLSVCFMLIVEWMQREKQHGLQDILTFSRPVRWSAYLAICTILI